MSTGQDDAADTSAGTMDGLMETASTLGRTRVAPDGPAPIAAQHGTDMDELLQRQHHRRKLGEKEEVRTEDTGSGMEDVFSTNGRPRSSSGEPTGSELDGLLSVRAEREGRAEARSDLDDLLNAPSGGRSPKVASSSGLDDLVGAASSSRPREQPRSASGLDDLFGASSGGRLRPSAPPSGDFDVFGAAPRPKRPKSEPGSSSMDDFFGTPRKK